MNEQSHQIYRSFLVRCWMTVPGKTGAPPAWRFELRDVSAEPQKHRFSDIEQLKEFMTVELAAIAERGGQDDSGEDGRKGSKP